MVKTLVPVILAFTLTFNSLPVCAASGKERLQNITNSISEKAEEATSVVSDKAGELKNSTSEAADKAKKAAQQGSQKAKDAVQQGSEKAKDALQDGTQKAKQAADAAGDYLSDKAGEAGEAIKDETQKTKEAVKEGSEKAKQAADAAGDYLGEIAGEAGETISSGAQAVASGVQELFSQIDVSRFQSGWDYVVKKSPGLIAASITQENLAKAEGEVVKAIQALENDINKSAQNARGAAFEKGFVFEKWQADTFNIDAAAKRSKYTAETLDSNKAASVDVKVSDGQNASMKAYKSGADSAREQAALLEEYKDWVAKNPNDASVKDYLDNQLSPEQVNNLLEAKYSKMDRIIPSDQMDDAVRYLTGKLDDLPQPDEYSQAQQKAYKETMDNLKTQLQSKDGKVQSKPLSSDELQAITELAKEGKFDAEQFGITPSDYITRADILSDVIAPGAEAAMLQIALTVGPEIYAIIVDAAKNGNIDEEMLKKAGVDAVLAGSEGFVEGSVSSTILLACKAGKFGAQFKNVSPDTVAMITVLAIDAARYGYKLSKGEITPLDYTNIMAEETFVAIASQATGIAVAAILPMVPFSYMAGSMAGAMLASAGYSIGKDIVMEVKDAGGIGSILPAQAPELNIGKDLVASFDLQELIDGIKGYKLITKRDGTIVISGS